MRKYKRFFIVFGSVLLFSALLAGFAALLVPPSSREALSQFGSTGTEVRQIQTALKKQGYYTGSVDGIYGSQTQAAVRKFQA